MFESYTKSSYFHVLMLKPVLKWDMRIYFSLDKPKVGVFNFEA